ncbi:MAG: hypothetical protein OEY98_13515, partial [Acidimicrobiia bacterium]|nr:hypothetical protein [Acidimicrobiia bacterium]
FTDTEAVDGNGDYTTDPTYLTTAAGTYYWIASYSGDDSNAAASGSCGDEGETSTVDKEDPTIETLATASVTVGGVLSDTATLAGGFNPTGTITFTLYSDAECKTSVFTDTEAVDGNGNYTTDPTYLTTAAGTYYWIASYSGDANNDSVTGECQDEGETSVVNPATPSLSTVPKLLPNDTATLSGGFGTLSGTLSFELFATADCSGNAIYEETVDVDGAGDYATSNTSVFITADGTYSWLVTYTGDDNNAGAISTCDEEQMTIDFTPFE